MLSLQIFPENFPFETTFTLQLLNVITLYIDVTVKNMVNISDVLIYVCM
jgi:hypothetical protein